MKFRKILQVDPTAVKQIAAATPLIGLVTRGFQPMKGNNKKLAKFDQTVCSERIRIGFIVAKVDTWTTGFNLGNRATKEFRVKRVARQPKHLQIRQSGQR